MRSKVGRVTRELRTRRGPNSASNEATASRTAGLRRVAYREAAPRRRELRDRHWTGTGSDSRREALLIEQG